jgi:hypothetical protein
MGIPRFTHTGTCSSAQPRCRSATWEKIDSRGRIVPPITPLGSVGKSTELVALCAYNEWTALLVRIPLPPLFGAPPTRPRPTSVLGANGLASCATRQSTDRSPIRSISSSRARAASTPVPLGSPGAWGELSRPDRTDARPSVDGCPYCPFLRCAPPTRLLRLTC